MQVVHVLVCSLVIITAHELQASDKIKSRTFRFRYGATLSGLADYKRVRVWLPVPISNAAQDVAIAGSSLRRGEFQRSKGERYGNSVLYFPVDATSNPIQFHVDYDVTRREVRALDENRDRSLAGLREQDRKVFLAPNLRVPIKGKPLMLLPNFGDESSTLRRARVLYDKVDSHVKYDKSKPGYGMGDVLWVCDSRFGNCTDFHSLFISLARSQSIPARFEIGFPLPPERGEGTIGGYHCWASFFEKSKGWVPVDISEADKQPEMKEYYFGNLTENRVAFSVGRDIILEPRQAGPPLNYFVYPYVEVDGKPLHREHITLEVSYKDVL